MEYRSSDGFTILVGRNNVQNDRLTLKDAHNYDMWFHTQKIPGSHTVVIADGKEIPDRTLEEAAVIAAYHSRAWIRRWFRWIIRLSKCQKTFWRKTWQGGLR